VTTSIANDLRASIAHILERYTGKPYDAIAPMRVAHIEAMGAYIERAEEAKANCTCEAVETFDPYRRETRLDYELKLGAAKRQREVNRWSGWDEVYAEVDRLRNAGLRENSQARVDRMLFEEGVA